MILAAAIPLLASLSPPPASRSVAAELAYQSSAVCLPVATGALVLAGPGSEVGADRQLTPFGLTSGINAAILDDMGPGSALLNRSTLAHVKRDGATIVMAAEGPQPGCRMILVGEPNAGLMDAATAELTTEANGWRALPGNPQTLGPATKRMFLRRSTAGKPVLLNLVALSGVPGKVQLFTTVIEVPAGVTLPPGY
jgi:hypothetical protein